MKKLLILILCMITLIPGCTAKKTTNEGCYPSALMWKDKMYYISGFQVNKEDIIKEVGKIERKQEPMPEKNGDSNVLNAGAKIYEFKGKNIDEFIVVERQDGGFYSAETLK